MKFLLFASLILSAAHASEVIDGNVETAVQRAEGLAKKYGQNKVMFVTDLDNTVLKADQDLASEPWFGWQFELLSDTTSDRRVACDKADLINLYHLAIELSLMSPVQEGQDEIIGRLKEAKVYAQALTARGAVLASSTFRELNRNKLDFSKTSIANGGWTTPYLPDGIQKPALVLYERGVFFADGQHKGNLLRSLLKKTKADIKGVVFFDNDPGNAQKMVDAFKDTDIEVISVRANAQDADIQRFRDANKDAVTQDFVVLRRVLDGVYHYPRPCALPIDKRVSNP